MKFEYLNYNRSFKKLPHNIQENVSKAISQFIDFILTSQKPKGLGLTEKDIQDEIRWARKKV